MNHENDLRLTRRLLGGLCFAFLLALTIVSFAPALLVRIDEWTDNLKNQLLLFEFSVGIIFIFTIRWAVRIIRR